MKTKVIILILTIMLSVSLNGQTIIRQVISPIGSSSTVDGKYVSHTVGQSTPPASTVSGNIGLRQGFEQPPKVKIVPKVDDNLKITIFPNPNNGQFMLNVETKKDGQEYSFDVFNDLGKLIFSGSGVGNSDHEVILPTNTARSTYMIKIKTDNGDTGEGKIIVIGY